MNIGQIKLFAWLATGLLTAALALYIATFIKGFGELSRPLDPKVIDAALRDSGPVETKSDDLVNYDDVRRLILPSCEKCKGNPNCRHLNWTGKQAVIEVAPTPGEVETVNFTPVKDLLRVLMVKVDLADPAGSTVYMKYKPAAQVTVKSPTGGFQFKVGDHLHAPHASVIIQAITGEGVVFAFGGERKDETLGPGEFDAKTRVVVVGPDGVMMPRLPSLIAQGPTEVWTPERTVAISNGNYRLGTEDAKEFEANWDKIIAHDVRPERHKDPRTGKYDGIELKTVAPGSIAARHGAKDGDVIKSINGTPVTSTQEAIQFVKNNKNQYSTWEVVIENRGRTRTQVYHSQNR
jgi:hypothetical protein